jgi:hypothetical protein
VHHFFHSAKGPKAEELNASDQSVEIVSDEPVIEEEEEEDVEEEEEEDLFEEDAA